MPSSRIIVPLVLSLGLGACMTTDDGEDGSITLENGGKSDGARLRLALDATHNYQSLELLCDSPSGCDVAGSFVFYNAWGQAKLDEPTHFAIAQFGAKVEPDASNRYTISTAGDIADADAERSYFFVRGDQTNVQSLLDGKLDFTMTVPNGAAAISLGRASGSPVEGFSVGVSVSWTPHPR